MPIVPLRSYVADVNLSTDNYTGTAPSEEEGVEMCLERRIPKV